MGIRGSELIEWARAGMSLLVFLDCLFLRGWQLQLFRGLFGLLKSGVIAGYLFVYLFVSSSVLGIKSYNGR